MHRDKKVGLALGVLLIGVVGAFFFRNETDEFDDLPRLDEPEKIDSRIAEGVRGPDLTGLETDEDSEPSAPATMDADGQISQWPLPGFLQDENDLADSIAPPDPIAVSADDFPVASGVPIPRHNNAWQAADNSERAESRTYRVQQGDTLSGLAARFLGSSARHGKILEANRDQLKRAKDLAAGMVIRIPGGNVASVSSTRSTGRDDATDARPVSTRNATGTGTIRSSDHSNSVEEPPKPTPLRDLRRLFRPAGRNPLSPGRSSRKTSQSTSSSSSRKRLTQTPPSDLPVIDGIDVADSRGAKTTRSTPHNYTVRRGDNLEKIALRIYGKRSAAGNIYKANRDRMKNPNALREGMTIVLP